MQTGLFGHTYFLGFMFYSSDVQPFLAEGWLVGHTYKNHSKGYIQSLKLFCTLHSTLVIDKCGCRLHNTADGLWF
jgi:hypothetical protein